MLNSARAVLNFAHRTGLAPDDQAWRLVKPFRGVGSSRKVILTDVEIQRLIDACGPGLRELVVLGAWTGARWGELAGTRVRDFDAKAGTLALDGKTGPREICLPPPAVRLLRRQAAGKQPNTHLLTPGNGAACWTENLHRRPLQRAVRAAGLDRATVFYSLRHSYISRALRELVPIKALADHCGTSMAMIERTYGKFVPDDRRRYAALAAPDLEC